MEIERFDGHLVQMDFDQGRIQRLHLVSRDDQRLVLEIGVPDNARYADIEELFDGPVAFLARDQRPTVTITQELG